MTRSPCLWSCFAQACSSAQKSSSFWLWQPEPQNSEEGRDVKLPVECSALRNESRVRTKHRRDLSPSSLGSLRRRTLAAAACPPPPRASAPAGRVSRRPAAASSPSRCRRSRAPPGSGTCLEQHPSREDARRTNTTHLTERQKSRWGRLHVLGQDGGLRLVECDARGGALVDARDPPEQHLPQRVRAERAEQPEQRQRRHLPASYMSCYGKTTWFTRESAQQKS